MTPKERAKDLLDKFETEIGCSDFHVPEFITGIKMADGSPEYTKILEEETKSLAKQCALIAVQMLIDENEQIEDMVGQGFNLTYWQSVKTELNNI